MIDRDILRRAQQCGWHIESVEADRAIVKCSRAGCQVKIAIRPGAPLPKPIGPPDPNEEHVVHSYDDLRQFLRNARFRLNLSMWEVEDSSGLADTFINKAEKEEPARFPGVEALSEWAGALGYEIVMRRKALPPLTLAKLVDEPAARARRQKHREFHMTRGPRKPRQE